MFKSIGTTKAGPASVTDEAMEGIGATEAALSRNMESETNSLSMAALSLRKAIYRPFIEWVEAYKPNSDDLIGAIADLTSVMMGSTIDAMKFVNVRTGEIEEATTHDKAVNLLMTHQSIITKSLHIVCPDLTHDEIEECANEANARIMQSRAKSHE